MFLPRIQARVGQAEGPSEVEGKWFFEITLSAIGYDEKEVMGPFGPYDTSEQAQAESMEACKMISNTFEQKLTGGISNKYYDMKSGTMRNWDQPEKDKGLH